MTAVDKWMNPDLNGPFELLAVEFIPHSQNEVKESIRILLNKGTEILQRLLGRSMPPRQAGVRIQLLGFDGMSKSAISVAQSALYDGLRSGMGWQPYQPNGFEPYWIDVQLIYRHRDSSHEERAHTARVYYHRDAFATMLADLRKLAELPSAIDMNLFTCRLQANGLISGYLPG